jgi:hypothetical protein
MGFHGQDDGGSKFEWINIALFKGSRLMSDKGCLKGYNSCNSYNTLSASIQDLNPGICSGF